MKTAPELARRFALSLVLLAALLVTGGPNLCGQGSKSLRDCPIHPGENPVTCPKCAKRGRGQNEDAECQEAKAYILQKSKSYSEKDVADMSCYWAINVVASNLGRKTSAQQAEEARRQEQNRREEAKRREDDSRRQAEQNAFYEGLDQRRLRDQQQQRQQQAESDAKRAREDAERDAKRDNDKAATKRIEEQVKRLRNKNNSFNPDEADGDPAAMRTQAEQDLERAEELEEQSSQALLAGNYQQSQALEDAASELKRRANNLKRRANDLESAARSRGRAVETVEKVFGGIDPVEHPPDPAPDDIPKNPAPQTRRYANPPVTAGGDRNSGRNPASQPARGSDPQPSRPTSQPSGEEASRIKSLQALLNSSPAGPESRQAAPGSTGGSAAPKLYRFDNLGSAKQYASAPRINRFDSPSASQAVVSTLGPLLKEIPTRGSAASASGSGPSRFDGQSTGPSPTGTGPGRFDGTAPPPAENPSSDASRKAAEAIKNFDAYLAQVRERSDLKQQVREDVKALQASGPSPNVTQTAASPQDRQAAFFASHGRKDPGINPEPYSQMAADAVKGFGELTVGTPLVHEIADTVGKKFFGHPVGLLVHAAAETLKAVVGERLHRQDEREYAGYEEAKGLLRQEIAPIEQKVGALIAKAERVVSSGGSFSEREQNEIQIQLAPLRAEIAEKQRLLNEFHKKSDESKYWL